MKRLIEILELLRSIRDELVAISANMRAWHREAAALRALLQPEETPPGLPEDFPQRERLHAAGIYTVADIPLTAARLRLLGLTFSEIAEVDFARRKAQESA